MRLDLSMIVRGPEAAAAVGRDGPPGLEGVLDVAGRPAPVPVLRIADIVMLSCRVEPVGCQGQSTGWWLVAQVAQNLLSDDTCGPC